MMCEGRPSRVDGSVFPRLWVYKIENICNSVRLHVRVVSGLASNEAFSRLKQALPSL